MAQTTPKTAVKKTPATKAAAKAAPAKTAAEPKAAAPKAVAKKSPVKKTAGTKTAAAPATNLLVMPSHDAISRRAYELWAERGFTHGDPNHDWARAEHELRRA